MSVSTLLRIQSLLCYTDMEQLDDNVYHHDHDLDDNDDNDVDNDNDDSSRRDSELGRMLMTCGKLSNQAPPVKSRLNGSRYSSAQ